MSKISPIANYPVLQFFAYSHLPEELQTVSKPFAELAYLMADELNSHDSRGNIREIEKMLDKLLEAKDCAVRAAIAQPVIWSVIYD